MALAVIINSKPVENEMLKVLIFLSFKEKALNGKQTMNNIAKKYGIPYLAASLNPDSEFAPRPDASLIPVCSVACPCPKPDSGALDIPASNKAFKSARPAVRSPEYIDVSLPCKSDLKMVSRSCKLKIAVIDSKPTST